MVSKNYKSKVSNVDNISFNLKPDYNSYRKNSTKCLGIYSKQYLYNGRGKAFVGSYTVGFIHVYRNWNYWLLSIHPRVGVQLSHALPFSVFG